jgi:hypothetical protein
LHSEWKSAPGIHSSSKILHLIRPLAHDLLPLEADALLPQR